MIDVKSIAQMQVETTALWHRSPYENNYEGALAIACQQHRFNYELWHEEDIARSKEVSDAQIANVKRAIDRLNQQRNDWIEKLDDCLTQIIESRAIQVSPEARQNSETPGSIVDRMSIMALRIYHLGEQLERTDCDEAHLKKVSERLAICRLQRADLENCLKDLLQDIAAGAKRHRTYRQFKMYNDPSMNPYLYKQQFRQSA
jgi:hypothetical protein